MLQLNSAAAPTRCWQLAEPIMRPGRCTPGHIASHTRYVGCTFHDVHTHNLLYTDEPLTTAAHSAHPSTLHKLLPSIQQLASAVARAPQHKHQAVSIPDAICGRTIPSSLQPPGPAPPAALGCSGTASTTCHGTPALLLPVPRPLAWLRAGLYIAPATAGPCPVLPPHKPFLPNAASTSGWLGA
jgi:hypothetical protein